jgi:oligopeptide/dipeptide ABC transporter ATP-binding protein
MTVTQADAVEDAQPSAPAEPARRPRSARLPRSAKIWIGLGLLGVFVLVSVIGPWLAPYPPGKINANTTPGPTAQHWLGETQLGQDIWSQLLVGARATLVVSFLAGAIATVLSIIIGITAGYVGGWLDELLSMLANVFLVLPALPLLIVVGSFMPKGDASSSLFIGGVIALTGWAWGARVLRAQSLSLRNRDFVEAARISGERTWRVIGFEIVPNLVPILASSFLFTVLYAIGTYVALGFLGVLNPAVNWSWGSIMFDATQGQAVSSGQWWWYLPPGLCIALLGTSLALINFGIDEFVNPRLRAAGLTRKTAKRQGRSRRPQLGFTPVVRTRKAADPPTPAENVTLDVHGLSVDYGSSQRPVHAVDGVQLTIRRGEVVGLAGESGSGKSTLAYAVTRLLRDPGVIVDGHARFRTVDLLAADKRTLRVVRWSEIAVVFQSALNSLNPVLTIGVLLDDVLKRQQPRLPAQARRERAIELLGLVGITGDRLDSYAHELSGGMRQRVMIAISIALGPQLLIMDEPTTALDVVIQREILDELMSLREKLHFSVLFITHDLSLLIELADTIAVMYAGKIVEKAPARTLFHEPRHPYTSGLLHSFPPLHGVRVQMTGISGSPPDLRHVPSGCPFRPRCAHAMDICATTTPPITRADGIAAGAENAREVSCWLAVEDRPEVPADQPDGAERQVRA